VFLHQNDVMLKRLDSWRFCLSVVNYAGSVALQKVRGLLSSKKVRDVDAVRLVMLYALRYEKHSNNDISGLIGGLQRRGVPEKLVKVFRTFIHSPGTPAVVFLDDDCVTVRVFHPLILSRTQKLVECSCEKRMLVLNAAFVACSMFSHRFLAT
jgi:hypothetical protein